MKMTKKLASLLLVIALLCTLLPTSLASALTATPQENDPTIHLEEGGYVPGQLLVGIDEATYYTTEATASFGSAKGSGTLSVDPFAGLDILSVRDLTDAADIVEENTTMSARVVVHLQSAQPRLYEGRQILLVELASDSEEDLLDAIELLEQNPMVAYAEPNFITEAYALPDDQYFLTDPLLWGMDKIQAPLAWDMETGNSSVRVGSWIPASTIPTPIWPVMLMFLLGTIFYTITRVGAISIPAKT